SRPVPMAASRTRRNLTRHSSPHLGRWAGLLVTYTRAAGAAEGAVMPDEGFTELAGERVLLRRFQLADVAEFVAYRSCAEVARFQSWDAPYPRDEGERFARQMMKRHPDTAGEWFQFAVVLRSAGQLIGDCAALPHSGDPRQCEIGFTIAPGHQGHGYATEAARLLVGYLFG